MTTNAPALVLPDPADASNPLDESLPSSLHDIKPPVEIISFWDIILWGAVILIFLGVCYAAWRYWMRKQTRRPAAEEWASRIPPNERARQRLDAALEHLHDPKFFCTLVSDAIRQYLEEQFDLRVPERTTEEFLSELQHSTLLDYAQKETLGSFLNQCDMVKFAKAEMLGKELQGLHQSALQFVRDTDSGVFGEMHVNQSEGNESGAP